MAEGFLSRRQFVAGSAALAMAGMFGALTGCTAGGSGAAAGADTASASAGGDAASSTDPITMVWLPDNSSADLTSSREAIGAAITAACGREANLLTTTDYNVAIESIASGKAQMALLGPEGYVQANKKNPKVLAAFTNSDEDGGLDGACYYSRICVRKEDADQYKNGGSFFSEVLFGNSHVGSLVNLLSGDADAAAFDDVDVDMYLDLVSGEANSIGAVYKAKDDAEAPVDSVRGKEFTIIAITPVLNSPICFNEEAISDDDRTKIIDYFSDKVANDKAIFIDPEDENAKGLFEKDSEKTCFVKTDDAWYEPIRKLGGTA